MLYCDYFLSLENVEIDKDKIDCIEKIYETKFCDLVNRILSDCDDPIFVEDDRILSFDEIEHASEDLEIDFKKMNSIPLIDCTSNDYILYNYETKFWNMFNAVDKTSFLVSDSLEELISKRYD